MPRDVSVTLASEHLLGVWLPWDGRLDVLDGYYERLIPVMWVRNNDSGELWIENEPADAVLIHLQLSSMIGPAYQQLVVELLGDDLYGHLIYDEIVGVGTRYAFVEGIDGRTFSVSEEQLEHLRRYIDVGLHTSE